MKVRRQAFTLIEIMIVIMLLAILAAIVVPRIVAATDDARESALETDLQMMRRQILVYKAQHGGNGPHLDADGNLDKENFPARLTGRTDATGTITPTGQYGPYMKVWPINPFITSPDAGAIATGTDTSPPRDGTTGWYYNTDTCVISANSAVGGECLDPTTDDAKDKSSAPSIIGELSIP